MCKIINIDDIEKSEDKTLYYTFEDMIEGVETVNPVFAELEITSLGEFIEVVGNVSGKAKFVCDRCLKDFEYDFDFEIEELFAKNALLDEYGSETELKDGQFITDLNGQKEIDIYDLLYQSLILNLPNKKVCGINCSGDNFLKEEDLIDPRMNVFKDISINPKNK